jgi:class 3 adenylate cyclase
MTQKDYRLAAIMFTDIYSFSKMMEKDEAGTLALLHTH